MRIWPILAGALLTLPVAAQELPMTREGLDSALAQFFAGADRDQNGSLDRAEAAAALGVARSMLSGRRDEEPFMMDVGPDGRPRLTLNDNGPLSRSGMLDMLFRRTDRDASGTLSLAEVQAAGRERFDAVDSDGDGILDERERQAAKQQLGMLKALVSGGR